MTRSIADKMLWAEKQGWVSVARPVSGFAIPTTTRWWLDRKGRRVGRYQSSQYYLAETGLYTATTYSHGATLYAHAEHAEAIAKLWEQILFGVSL